MFQIVIQKSGLQPTTFQQTTYVDTLREVEILAKGIAEKHFFGMSLVLVHRGSLIYDIYKVEGIIGKIRIKSIGG